MIYAILIGLVVLTGLAAVYLWKRLVWDTTRSRRARVLGSVIAVLLAALIPVTMAAETVPAVAWPGFIWLAFVFYLFLVLLLVGSRRWRSPGGCAGASRRRMTPGPAAPPSRTGRIRIGGCCWPAARRSSPGSPPPASSVTGCARH